MSRILSQARDEVEKLFKPGDQDRREGIQRTRALSNAGLVWDRYLDLWKEGPRPMLAEGEDRRRALDVFASDVSCRSKAQKPSASHPRALLATVHRRQERVLQGSRGKGLTHQAKLTSRLTTGLGAPHPTEIGFTFDRSIGVPYLPGSSVKGLCRGAAGFRDLDRSQTETLFGPERIEGRDSGCAGDLVFLDAYPSDWPTLELDVINCHHPGYYGGGLRYPAETEDPVPVYFLTVASGTEWTFRFQSRSGEHADEARSLLRTALTELGAGGKTSVGYGAF